MDRHDLIERKPEVALGKAVFNGTRLTVENVLTELGRGMSEAEFLRGHARLTANHLRAAMLYAAAALNGDEIAYR